MNAVLIIFIKNPVPGKVKTRLAKSIGNEKALSVYRKLVDITLAETSQLEVQKEIWYSDYIDWHDQFDNNHYSKHLQRGRDLGERMHHAFKSKFSNDVEKAVIIGSDCPDLTKNVIEKAFQLLDDVDLVFGPSLDGGYYLLGMNRFYGELFSNIEWSSTSVYTRTLQKAEKLNLKTTNLPALNDIDTVEDLKGSSIGEDFKC